MQSRLMNGAVVSLAAELEVQGYARVSPSFLMPDCVAHSEAILRFLASCRDLPSDPHCSGGVRYRRYGRFMLRPDTLEITVHAPTFEPKTGRAVVCYAQSANNNPEHAGRERRFDALLPEQSNSPFLRTAIARCFGASSWPHGNTPAIVGVHIVMTIARPDVPGVSTPDHLHQDGEPVTWAFLLSRSNVIGGENVIALPCAVGLKPAKAEPANILTRFTLERQLSGWVVDDRRVSHYASPIMPIVGAAHGHRTILLIDFTPDSDAAR